MPMKLGDLARTINAALVGGRDDIEITGCGSIETAGPSEVAFIANARYQRHLATTAAAAVIVNSKVAEERGAGPQDADATAGPPALLVCDDPYFGFRNAMIALHGFRSHPDPIAADQGGKSRLAVIHPEAEIGDGTRIHPFVVIERSARIGSNCTLYPGAYVGEDSTLGDGCVLHPNVVIYERCRIGNRVILHSGTVVGQDGFGYATHKENHEIEHHKIPQYGIVVIEDDVECGAGCAIERAAMGETRIGAGTKLADLISIGHGTKIGRHCLLVSLVGVSGSVDMGDYVVLGGQVGITGHLKIGDNVQAAGKSAIVSDVPSGSRIGGMPAIDLEQAKRNALVGRDLYGLAKKVRQLERELRDLKRKKDK